MGRDLKFLCGRFVENVVLDAKLDVATLVLDDGQRVRFSLDGDCCSHSYFRDLKDFDELKMCRIQEAEDRDGTSDGMKRWDEANTDVLSYHFLVFTTDKGHVTIDWRNDSNGYYDGSVEIEIDGQVKPRWED